ncbi:MAG: cytochrome C [Planctomycetes bacterium]|nr:cytochrome C [Planctomycetota bacterium]
MLVLVGGCTWWGLRQAALNDERLEKGLPPMEADNREDDKVYVWPDLVYAEFIALIICSIVLIVWSILLAAPLEQPANPARTPNPSKAPWYFLGLQEMLVYFDPWIAGVVLPTLIIIGLGAIPYIDKNPKGNGYYTFKERPFAVTIYMFGFLVLWVFLVYMGTFMRGPNWNFFGPYEYWDIHKLEPLTSVNLSEYFYMRLLGRAMPANFLVREAPGLLVLAVYFGLLPLVLAKTCFRKFYPSMGFLRYMVMINLFLGVVGMVAKMYLRWIFNLKYIVAFPEFFFNI